MGRHCLKKTSNERKFDDWPVVSKDADVGVLVWGPGVPVVTAFQMTLMGILPRQICLTLCYKSTFRWYKTERLGQ